MEDTVNVQSILTAKDLKKLKDVTGETTTKQALRVAVEHTIKTYKKETDKPEEKE